MKKYSNQTGFTLTEVIIAVAIFSVAAVTLMAVLPVSANGIRDAARSSEGINLAKGIFADLEIASETSQWPSETYQVELPSSTGVVTEEFFLTEDGKRVEEASQAAYRCDLLMKVRENNENAVHIHAQLSWPAPASIDNAQGSVELVSLIEKRS